MKGPVNVAIIGVGNCASSLVQGVQYYRDATDDEFVPGLMHVNLGGYHVSDINFTAAFDIDARKVGRDLGEAIYTEPNNTYRFAEVPKIGVTVQRGMTHDGLGKYLSEVITKAPGPTADIVQLLKRHQHARRRELPAGGLRARDQVVRRADPARRLRVRELRAGVHRPRAILAAALRRAWPADRSATTSRARSAPRSCTARSLASCASAA